MGSTSSREMINPYAVNTPLIGICFTSMLFNSVQGGTLRSSNVYNNFIIIYMLGFSTGCSTVLNRIDWGAKLGMLAALCFTFGPNVKLLYTQRLFPDYVRYGIGGLYTTYYALQLYRDATFFEDAMEADGREEKRDLRKHFESVGHITDFRFLGPTAGRDFRYGFADYLDLTSAEEAIARLNGTSFGERAIKVMSAANSRGRKRARQHNYVPPEMRGGMVFPRGYIDPLLGRDDTSVLGCLQRMAPADAYEAVEQLRVLVLERKAEARLLLESTPALRLAVVMILQHAGRLPFGPLPPDALQQAGAAPSAAAEAAEAAKADKTARADTTMTQEDRDEVVEILTRLSEEEVERIINMSDADLERIPDMVQRQQISVLRNRLLEMADGLE